MLFEFIRYRLNNISCELLELIINIFLSNQNIEVVVNHTPVPISTIISFHW